MDEENDKKEGKEKKGKKGRKEEEDKEEPVDWGTRDHTIEERRVLEKMN